MIDLELERKAFEKHASKFFRTSEAFEVKNDSYIYDEVIFMWDCWLHKAQQSQAKIEALEEKLAKVESGEFVVVPKSEIGNYYFDDSECIYIDEPDSFLSELDVGEVCEVKRRDYFDLPTQYAAKVFIDIDNIEWRLFESELEAEIAANECKDKFWGEQGDGDE